MVQDIQREFDGSQASISWVKTALGLEFSIPVIRYLLPPLQIPHLSLCWALDLLFEESLPYYAGYAVSLLLFSGLLVLYGFGVHQHPDQP